MAWLKEFIDDNVYLYRSTGFTNFLVVWLKLIGYLVVVPSLNIFFLWKVWWFGILLMPMSYVSYVIALKGQAGVNSMLIEIMEGYIFIKQKLSGIFKK